MANEQISVEVETIPQTSDHDKKRKLEDLKADTTENVDDGRDAVPDIENKCDTEKEEGNVTEEAGGELKRARLEKIEEDDDVEVAGIESEVPLEKSLNASNENGDAFEDNGDKVVDAEEEKVDQEPESLQDNNIPKEDTFGVEQPQETSASDDVGQVADGDVQVQRAAESEQSGQNEQNIENENENESGAVKLEGMEAYSDINLDGDGLTAEQKSESTDEIISRKIEVSNNKVGVLIGKAGDTIKYLQYNSGAKIQIMRDSEADSLATTRPVELIGTLDCIEKAERLIKDVIAEAEAGGSPALVARGFNSVQSVVGGEQIEMQVPNEKVGSIIGRGGENIKYLQTRSGARIQLVPQHLPSGDQSKERTVRMTGDKKQIEMAKEMIKEVMNQNSRSSSHSGGYNQHSHRSRGHGGGPHWGHRSNNHPSQSMGYGGYQQRGPYQPQNHQQYPPAYGNYPPQQAAPRGNYGPGWEQRPPSNMQGPPPQSNYNYGQPQGPDYGHQNPYSQPPAQSYGQGYNNNEMRYDNTVPPQQPYGGPGVPQPAGYHHGGGGGGSVPAGYGPQDQYGRPSPYGMQQQQQQPAQGQTYGQPRPNQPGENPYQTPVSATQPYGSNVPPQQSYPYAASGPVQQNYPMYPSGPTTTDGYTQPASGGPVYPQQGGQYAQPVAAPPQQQPSGYAVAAGPTTGYGAYPSQQGGYLEQQQQSTAANTAAYGGYQQQPTGADPAAYASAQGSTGYAQPAPTQPGYTQQAPTQPGYAQPAPSQPGYTQPAPSQPVYDQSIPAQSGGYGTTAAAPAGYGNNNVSPQPGYPPQYDANQMYAAAPPR